jgi:AcrR family transcriptional regulator
MTGGLNKSQDIILTSRQRILKIASDLFSEFGFLGASMEDIAKHLNITKAALYYHFGSKKELYLEVLRESFQDLTETINKGVSKAESPKEIVSWLIKSYLAFGIEEKNLIKSLILKTPNIDPEIVDYITRLREKTNRQFEIFLRKFLKRKNLIQKVDLKFITSFLLGTMDRLILEASLFDKKLNIKKKSSQILEIIDPMLKVESKQIN